MAGMRNKIVHDYQEVDLNIVWQVIEQIKPLLPDINKN